MAHPPVWSVDGEGKVVNDMVAVLAAVGKVLDPRSKARQAQLEVGADCTLDAHGVADVISAVFAVKQSPASKRYQQVCDPWHKASLGHPNIPSAGLFKYADSCAVHTLLLLVPA